MLNIKQIKFEEKEEKWYDEFLYHLRYNCFTCFFYHSFRFLKRLPKYLKLAWDQENWDYEYLYDLIEMKIKEFKKAQEEDDMHVGSQRRALKAEICLKRLDRFRNWQNYCNFPMDDVISENGLYQMKYLNPENEKQRHNAYEFEKKNYHKFWKDFLKWHQEWWT